MSSIRARLRGLARTAALMAGRDGAADRQIGPRSALTAQDDLVAVVDRSYGGWVATDLALRYPDPVRALALLEPDAPGLSPAADGWVFALNARLREVAAQAGVDAVGEALIGEVAGEDAWHSFPDDFRRMLTDNGRAILADLRSYEGPHADAAALATIKQPVLLVTAADSPPEFHEAPKAMADVLPNARATLVGGGHLIDPAAPEVLAFIEEVLESP